MRERDKEGILLELDNRFQAVERRVESLKEKLEEFKKDLEKSRLQKE